MLNYWDFVKVNAHHRLMTHLLDAGKRRWNSSQWEDKLQTAAGLHCLRKQKQICYTCKVSFKRSDTKNRVHVVDWPDTVNQEPDTYLLWWKFFSHSCQSRCCRLPGAGWCPKGVALVLGGGRGSWTPVLLEENDHLALGHHHSGSNSAADLATPMRHKGSGFLTQTVICVD